MDTVAELRAQIAELTARLDELAAAEEVRGRTRRAVLTTAAGAVAGAVALGGAHRARALNDEPMKTRQVYQSNRTSVWTYATAMSPNLPSPVITDGDPLVDIDASPLGNVAPAGLAVRSGNASASVQVVNESPTLGAGLVAQSNRGYGVAGVVLGGVPGQRSAGVVGAAENDGAVGVMAIGAVCLQLTGTGDGPPEQIAGLAGQAGMITADPDGSSAFTTSTINFPGGFDCANASVVALGAIAPSRSSAAIRAARPMPSSTSPATTGSPVDTCAPAPPRSGPSAAGPRRAAAR